YTNGGRVLSVVALGKDLKEARAKAYAEIKKINFEGMQYRRDIGEQV
ncbi:MAG: phosphoribosylamine--glycine ligase, partial [Elusimicrobiota bacterium]|nr:phosphoribosylamine--glycine ligase [Elusimicrobiota bacterium]